jgi:molybdopterin biosynthesis enzyme
MGKDCRVGEVLIDPNTVIHAEEIGKALSAGVTHATVYRYQH